MNKEQFPVLIEPKRPFGSYSTVVIKTINKEYIVFKEGTILEGDNEINFKVKPKKWDECTKSQKEYFIKKNEHDYGAKYFDIIVDELRRGRTTFKGEKVECVYDSYYVVSDYKEFRSEYNIAVSMHASAMEDDETIKDVDAITYMYNGSKRCYAEQRIYYDPKLSSYQRKYYFDELTAPSEGEVWENILTHNPQVGFLDKNITDKKPNNIDLVPEVFINVVVKSRLKYYTVYTYSRKIFYGRISIIKTEPYSWARPRKNIYEFDDDMSIEELAKKYYEIVIEDAKSGKNKIDDDIACEVILRRGVISIDGVYEKEYNSMVSMMASSKQKGENFQTNGTYSTISGIYQECAVCEEITELASLKESKKYIFDIENVKYPNEDKILSFSSNPHDGILNRNYNTYGDEDYDDDEDYDEDEDYDIDYDDDEYEDEDDDYYYEPIKIKPIVSEKPKKEVKPKKEIVYHISLSNLTKKSEGFNPIFSENELSNFWDLDQTLISKVLTETGLNINEALYPVEKKLVNVFYLVVISYIIKHENFVSEKVINYIKYLESSGWKLNNYVKKIINIIDMLKNLRSQRDNLDQLKSWLLGRI